MEEFKQGVNDNSGGQQQNSLSQKKEAIDDIEKLKIQIKEFEQKVEQYLNGWKRAKADFINYKKEQEQIFEEFIKFSNQNLILQILPVLDNFNLALKHLPKEFENNEWAKGILYIKTQLEDILKNQGVEEIKTIGEKFNPEFHEVVSGDEQGDVIVEEIQKGYMLHGKLVRAAKVKVGNNNNLISN